MRYTFILSLFLFMAACSSDSNDGDVGGNGGNTGIESILSGNQVSYTEQYEEQNNSRLSPEDPSYTLDANGIELRGVLALNSLDNAADVYLIYSGSASKIDLQVFLNGVALQNDDPRVDTDFDALVDDGVSTLYSNSFRSIPVLTDTYYVIVINVGYSNNSALNQSYVIEVKASSG